MPKKILQVFILFFCGQFLFSYAGAETNYKIRLLKDEEFFPVLLEKIQSAHTSILVTSFVFKTSSSLKNKATLILEALKKVRQKKKIKIRVILEQSNYQKSLNKENRATLKKLKKAKILTYQDSPQRTLHSKLFVIDGQWTFLGSHNLTDSALGKNREVSVLIHSKPFAKEIIDYIRQIKFKPTQ